MALSNLFGWNTKKETAAAAACGTACGAGDKPKKNRPPAELPAELETSKIRYL